MESQKAYAYKRYKRKQRNKMIKANNEKFDKDINEDNNIYSNKAFNNDISEINVDNNKNNKANDNIINENNIIENNSIISNEDNKNNFKNKSLNEDHSKKDNNNFKSCEIHHIKSINIIKQIFKFLEYKNYVYKLFNYSKSLKKK